MKRIVLLALFASLFGSFALKGQSCLPEGIEFTTQAEIDNFATNYPGCTEIEGDVVINGPNPLNLNGLSVLNRVGGGLRVSNTSMTSLEGLDNIDFVGGDLIINFNDLLTSLSGLESIDSVQGFFGIDANLTLSGLQALANLSYIGGSLSIASNLPLTNLNGLENLRTIGAGLYISYQEELTSLEGLSNLISVGENAMESTIVGIQFAHNPSLIDLSALSNMQPINCFLSFFENAALVSLEGLEHITSLTSLDIDRNVSLTSLNGLNNLGSVEGFVNISSNPALNSLEALSNLASIQADPTISYGALYIAYNDNLQSLAGLENLTILQDELSVESNPILESLNGLEGITSVNVLKIRDNDNLNSLAGLDSLRTVRDSVIIVDNSSLTNLQGLHHLQSIGGLTIAGHLLLNDLSAFKTLTHVNGRLNISNNPSLSDCSILSVCNQLIYQPDNINIHDNAPGCASNLEVETECNGTPVLVRVLRDSDGDCEPDDAGAPATGVHIRMNANSQTVTRPTNANGDAKFGYLDEGIFALSLPQFPTENWSVCQDTLWVDPADFQDTIRATFLLQPLNQCPDLSVNLHLPPTFRGCLVSSNMQVDVQNFGAVNAENTQVAVVLPSVLDVLSSTWPIVTQHGDTLFFNLGNLEPFEGQLIGLTVRTQCDTFLFGQTLCVEAFANAENDCPPIPPSFSEVRLFSECLDDETVRFTLKNVGNAPTQGIHEYVIIEDEVILMGADFDLNPNEERTVDVPANGATYRMEATRYMNGTLTAVALENCGGLTPGLVTAHWLDEGPEHYDFDCREVIVAYDPNQKTAIPKGIGEAHLLAANRPLQYTIDFQNTGTDTAFRVQLTDILSPHLDVNTFRPGFSSHPYSWEIRGLDTLVVLFFPIALPDSNVNVEGSQGFFTFDIQQKPDLPDGTLIENTASIVFDFNPPIVTNTTFHTIGELVVVFTNEPGQKLDYAWNVKANPMKAAATFEATRFVAGEKRFELFDAAGRKLRTERFEGQEFTFQRESLSGGLYFFRISDAEGRTFSGKIVVAN